jgi:hypothetical protein
MKLVGMDNIPGSSDLNDWAASGTNFLVILEIGCHQPRSARLLLTSQCLGYHPVTIFVQDLENYKAASRLTTSAVTLWRGG